MRERDRISRSLALGRVERALGKEREGAALRKHVTNVLTSAAAVGGEGGPRARAQPQAQAKSESLTPPVRFKDSRPQGPPSFDFPSARKQTENKPGRLRVTTGFRFPRRRHGSPGTGNAAEGFP